MKNEKSKLLLNTFDGTLKKLKLAPKCENSKVELGIKYFAKEDVLTNATMVFEQVIAIDFEVNYFDNFIGAELFGLYEIFDPAAKTSLIEKIFKNRLEGYLYHGNYEYDPHEKNDMLNYREPLEEIIRSINNYHLYQQQTQGGIYYVLAANYRLICK